MVDSSCSRRFVGVNMVLLYYVYCTVAKLLHGDCRRFRRYHPHVRDRILRDTRSRATVEPDLEDR